MDEPESLPLRLSIAGCSGFSASYAPDNVLVDRPNDQTSRWSGANTFGGPGQSQTSDLVGQGVRERQWILLKLDQPALVRAWLGQGMQQLIRQTRSVRRRWI